MISLFFNGLMNILVKIVQFFSAGLNVIIDTYLPDLSSQIVSTTTTITNFLVNLTWPLSIIPTPILNTLLFIIGIEIARHTIYISVHLIIKAFSVVRVVKFW